MVGVFGETNEQAVYDAINSVTQGRPVLDWDSPLPKPRLEVNDARAAYDAESQI